MINREQMIAIRTTLAGLPRTQTPGGSVCNTMRSMSSLGANSGFIGKIGDDSIGGFYEDALEKAGVTSYFIKTDGLTGSCTVMISPDGERTMGTFLGPAPTITPDEITEENQKKEVERKLFPSYVLVKMILTDDSWYVVRNIRGVTGFVGPGSKPVPLTDAEVARFGVETREIEVNYAVGDSVMVDGGYLEGFIGVVDSIDMDKQTVCVTVSMMGKEVPVELELNQVKPL